MVRTLDKNEIREWWSDKNDYLILSGKVFGLREMIYMEEQRIFLWENGWEKVEPIKINIKCEC